jgi:hypothetical protein
VIVSCPDCGPVLTATDAFEVHADREDRIALYAVRCPWCVELVTGGCRELIARLRARGARLRELRSPEAAVIGEREVAAFASWLATDPVWDLPD